MEIVFDLEQNLQEHRDGITIQELEDTVYLYTVMGIWKVSPTENGNLRIEVCNPGDEGLPCPEDPGMVVSVGKTDANTEGDVVLIERAPGS